jgi:hypothetical protein
MRWANRVPTVLTRLSLKLLVETPEGIFPFNPTVVFEDMFDRRAMRLFYEIAPRMNGVYDCVLYPINVQGVEEFYNYVMQPRVCTCFRKEDVGFQVFFMRKLRGNSLVNESISRTYTKAFKWIMTSEGSLSEEDEELISRRWLHDLDSNILGHQILLLASGIANLDQVIEEDVNREHDHELLRKIRCVNKEMRPSRIPLDTWDMMLEIHRLEIEQGVRRNYSQLLRCPNSLSKYLQMAEDVLDMTFNNDRIMEIARCIEVGEMIDRRAELGVIEVFGV